MIACTNCKKPIKNLNKAISTLGANGGTQFLHPICAPVFEARAREKSYEEMKLSPPAQSDPVRLSGDGIMVLNLQLLSPKEGDLVVVHFPKGTSLHQLRVMGDKIAEFVQRHTKAKCICFTDGYKLEVIRGGRKKCLKEPSLGAHRSWQRRRVNPNRKQP